MNIYYDVILITKNKKYFEVGKLSAGLVKAENDFCPSNDAIFKKCIFNCDVANLLTTLTLVQ